MKHVLGTLGIFSTLGTAKHYVIAPSRGLSMPRHLGVVVNFSLSRLGKG